MKSMTGFGVAVQSSTDVEIDVSIKAYNGRYLDIRCNMPREYESLESEIKKKISKKVSRGSVSIYINRKLLPGSKLLKVRVNHEIAKQWLAAMKDLGSALNLKDDLTLSAISKVPELVKLDQDNQVPPKEKAMLLKAIGDALDSFDNERSREGESLKKELSELVVSLNGNIEQVEKLMKTASAEVKAKMKKRLEPLLEKETIDPQRLAQEVALQVDKMDISEEVARLKEHVKLYSKEILKSGPIGKKLDFYTQELLREVNTMGSKSSLAKLNHLAVESKSLIERLREQVQNIE
jgi:uncharacterized protein (TIGR00255 family)